jgi:hypothetical protein
VVTNYAEARAEWLNSHRDLWFPLAQLLVSTVDVAAKSPPRSIRGTMLNKNERKYLADFQEHMRRALAETTS